MAKQKTLNLSEAATEAGISRGAAQKFKNSGQLTPFIIGEAGRSERYSVKIVKQLTKLRDAGLSKRGRPRKSA